MPKLQGELAATGYVVDQAPQLAGLPGVPRPGAVEDTPPLGPFRTFQAPLRDIATLTGLNLDELSAADRNADRRSSRHCAGRIHVAGGLIVQQRPVRECPSLSG